MTLDRPSFPQSQTPSELAARLGLRPGDIVGERYEIVRLIGEGGMGAVFEARHRVLGRVVAIKILKPEIARDEKLAGRFLQEAKAAAELHHRNIVELNDYGVDGERPYMVMELLRGETFARLIEREGPLQPARAVALLDPVLRALAMAHERGIVHRDIKPENIFLAKDHGDEEPTPKIVDFGIAKRHDENVQLTAANMALGTPAYMAPEQIMSSRDVTGAADQYAIGVTLYEALTGKGPYDAETLHAFIVAKATQDPTPLDQQRPDLDPGLVAVVMRSLARKPEDRFPSVQALREALAPYRASPRADSSMRPPPAAPSNPAPQNNLLVQSHPGVATPTNMVVPASTPAPPVAPPQSSRAPLWVAAGVVVLITSGLVTSQLIKRPTHDGAAPDAGVSVVTPPTPDARAETVVFSIRVEPATATIVLDGAPVGTGRAELVRPKDGQRHQLQLTAEGYGPVSEVLTADANVNLYRQLVALPPTPTTPERNGHTGGRHGRDRDRAAVDAGTAATAAHATSGSDAGASAPTHRETPDPPRPRNDPAHPHIDPTNPFATGG